MDNIIDKIFYINNDKDKDISIKSQLKIYKLNGKKIYKTKNLILSHIRCLEKAIKNNYKNILILEDDFMFSCTPNELRSEIKNFLKTIKKWDILMLSSYDIKKEEYSENIYKIINTNDFTGYLVNNNYYQVLLEIFKNIYNLYNQKQKDFLEIIQNKDNWFVIPNLGIKQTYYNKLEKRMVHYYNQPYIKCFLRGGLGNQLFEIANSYYLSKKYCKYLVLKGERVCNNVVYHNFNNKITYSNLDTDIIKEPNKYEEIILDKDKNSIIYGYFQSEKYFKEIKDEIIDLFYLDEENSNIVDELCKKYDINEKSVSLHVRRGDYTNYLHLFSVIPLFYYKNCIKYFGPNRRYIIFSNDIKWCKEQDIFKNLPFKTFVQEKDYIELFLMSKCKDNIITNSTFSWWGAYLNKNKNKTVIMPNRWYNINDENHYFDDIIPENWKVFYINNITFVTSIFEINEENIKKSLNMNYCFVIYIKKEDTTTKQYILNIRKNLLPITKIIEIDFEDKINLLYKTSLENPFNSDILFWIDIDFMKNLNSPYYYSNLDINKIPKDKVLFQKIYDNNEKKYNINDKMFGGYINSIKKWYNNHDILKTKNEKDLNNIVEKYPENVSVLNPKYENDSEYIFSYLNNIDDNFFTYFIKKVKTNSLFFFIFLSIILILIIFIIKKL
jgi:GR25 family glycosyltransferase involved in LPS biosynthesis